VTNGRIIAWDRSAVYRRYRDLVAIIATDQGGVDRLAEARMQLVRRFAALSVEAENMEARLCSGTPLPIADYCLIVSTLTRVASRIGISRTARDITPTLSKYLVEKEAEEIEAEAYEDA
jgi:hypothetical protein